MLRALAASLVCCVTLLADDKKPVISRAGNDLVAVTASVLSLKDVAAALGSDLGGYFVVVQVSVEPRSGAPLPVYRDDFLLRTDRDGEKSTPFAPSQIAGSGAMVISSTGEGGAVMGDSRGPVWGGYPGSTDRPRRMGGDGGVIGNSGGAGTARASLTTMETGKENPLLAALADKILPEDKECKEEISGLLYFPMEPKQKLKHLELIYTTPAGKLNLRFR
ncbi:MAG: hypothetical protein WD696_12415 [Bryobacteraceae bacterium]